MLASIKNLDSLLQIYLPADIARYEYLYVTLSNHCNSYGIPIGVTKSCDTPLAYAVIDLSNYDILSGSYDANIYGYDGVSLILNNATLIATTKAFITRKSCLED